MTQRTLDEYRASRTDREIHRTVRVPVETSRRKNARVDEVIEEWQSIASHAAALMPTVPVDRWGETATTWINDLAQTEHPTGEIDIYSHDRYQAYYKVSEAFGSWRENGRRGESPAAAFGDGRYARINSDYVSVHRNDRGYGIELGIKPYVASEWFHAAVGDYQREYLSGIVDGDLSIQTAELRRDGEGLTVHLTIADSVEVYDSEGLDRWVGVDLGEAVLYAVAAVDGAGDGHGRDDATVREVSVRNGREFRHHRERLDHKREQAMRRQAEDEIRAQRRRYTNHVTHRASRAIVDLAVEHRPCGIRVEDLTGYRETAVDPIHDWPHHELREKIAYKATEEGIPVDAVPARNTSITCRQCGVTNPRSRPEGKRDLFECVNCGYEVHADVNAAINVARGGVE